MGFLHKRISFKEIIYEYVIKINLLTLIPQTI